jgi:hypothetical protein
VQGSAGKSHSRWKCRKNPTASRFFDSGVPYPDPKPRRGDSLASACWAPTRSRKPCAVAENKTAVMAFGCFTNKPTCLVSCEASRNMAQMVFRLSFGDRVEMSEVAGGIETAAERVGDLLAQG